jgi:hypothetical protein
VIILDSRSSVGFQLTVRISIQGERLIWPGVQVLLYPDALRCLQTAERSRSQATSDPDPDPSLVFKRRRKMWGPTVYGSRTAAQVSHSVPSRLLLENGLRGAPPRPLQPRTAKHGPLAANSHSRRLFSKRPQRPPIDIRLFAFCMDSP